MTILNDEKIAKRFTSKRPAKYDALLAPDSYATRCFVQQGFSKNLQLFLIDYSLKLQSPLSHTIGTL